MPHFKVLKIFYNLETLNLKFMMKIMVNWTFMLKGSIKSNLSGAKISNILKSKMWNTSTRKFVYFDKINQFVSHKSSSKWHFGMDRVGDQMKLKSLQDCRTPLQPHHIPYWTIRAHVWLSLHSWATEKGTTWESLRYEWHLCFYSMHIGKKCKISIAKVVDG